MTTIPFTIGMTVKSRGERFEVVDMTTLAPGDTPIVRITLRGIDGELQGKELTVLSPVDKIEPDTLPDLELDHPGRLARFRLLHDVFRLRVAPSSDMLVGLNRARIRFEPYQYVPALRALELPRPRLLLADDVGLGKTIEAGLILRDLIARRRANRILIVAPAGIMVQWQQELECKFGLQFTVFDRDSIHTTRLKNEISANPWNIEPRVIASMDLIKRREGAFRELSSTRWDVVIVDEAHHLSGGRTDSDVTDRHRLGRWLADATDALLLLTATPHDGYDESFASLLALLEPSLLMPDGTISYQKYKRHLVRRLKRHIRNDDGTDKFFLRRVRPIPVQTDGAEQTLHNAVINQARELENLATSLTRQTDAEAIRLVATILRKRAASSRTALSNTLTQRQHNLSERIEEMEIQRDHLRALRRGDTLPDDTLAQLERDAHRSYLSVVRRLGQSIRRADAETDVLHHLQGLLSECEQTPESKMVALLNLLRRVHSEHSDDKVIIFSEYTDTVESIAATLAEEPDYQDKICVLTGDLALDRRNEVLEAFASPNRRLLIATDAAGEGLNLQRHCHRMVHFELPWNPNRLEQRNGRIDRYGQSHPPEIAFLYAEETYEGRVLALLIDKIERQIERLGSVGDTLGQLQVERLEQIISRCPDNVETAVSNAEREIEEEISRASNTSLPQILGTGSLDQQEVLRAEEAARIGNEQSLGLVSFLESAIRAVGDGHIDRRDHSIFVVTPTRWLSQGVLPRYTDLSVLEPGNEVEVPLEKLLHDAHPLVESAVRWVKSRRFVPEDDHRLAYVVSSAISEPDIIATFLIQLHDEVWHTEERLEAVRVNAREETSQTRVEDLMALDATSESNADATLLIDLFGSWWQRARHLAEQEARRRASTWRHTSISMRSLAQDELLRELNEWHQASQESILGGQRAQLNIFGPASIPPAVRRKLNQHMERFRQRRDYLDRHVRIAEPSIEQIGVLLRVPMSAVQRAGAR